MTTFGHLGLSKQCCAHFTSHHITSRPAQAQALTNNKEPAQALSALLSQISAGTLDRSHLNSEKTKPGVLYTLVLWLELYRGRTRCQKHGDETGPKRCDCTRSVSEMSLIDTYMNRASI